MKKISTILTFLLSANLFSAVEILDRVAVIVDDGLIMESQIKQSLSDIIQRYDQQNIPKPPPETLKDQVIERLVIEELQLQMANRAGVRISDTELNEAVTRIATNNNMQLQEFITFVEDDGASYEELREQIKREMIIQRIQRGRVGSEIDITEKEFDAVADRFRDPGVWWIKDQKWLKKAINGEEQTFGSVNLNDKDIQKYYREDS